MSTKAAIDETPETLTILLNRARMHAGDIATEHPPAAMTPSKRLTTHQSSKK
ncbi:hypothetical protein [Haladaptatus halobius]|uniref:hypothetical protein n=1 Tax=Haladaptatus halobius TaxID=2884875 RepID=UPI001D0A9952|nr:hypothetical protein [Haladaptatus halobius]